jgi:uncharacterized surface protein with fasciclin (FAS1) repeats
MKILSSNKWLLFFFGWMILSLNSCYTEYPVEPFFEGEDETIIDYITADEESFSNFENALLNSNLLMTLSARNPNGNRYTLFLPTDEAFEGFIENSSTYNSMDELLNDQDYLNELVKFHIVNSGFQTNDFPFGALPDTTLSGQILNVGFSGDWDSTVYRINNQASIIQPNIEMANGYIHVIDEILTPVVLNSYEWLEQNPDFTIFTEALELTGLKDTFEINNRIVPSTILVEPDAIYQKEGIYTIDDLIQQLSPDDNNFTSTRNNLFQFISYHILEGDLFLNDFEEVKTNFNTYGIYPIFIDGEGLDIAINPGSEVFDSIYVDNDTIYVNSIGIDYENSNILTQNGAIHRIDQVMKLYRPRPSTRTFSFYEEDVISEASNIPRMYIFEENDQSKFDYISWSGVEELIYVKSSNIEAYGDDYIFLNGDFVINYQIPKILPGEYQIQIRAQTTYSSNATLWIYLDGKKVGGSIDLTRGPDKWGNEYNWLDVGTISFDEYQSHEVKVEALINGSFYWDQIRFVY